MTLNCWTVVVFCVFKCNKDASSIISGTPTLSRFVCCKTCRECCRFFWAYNLSYLISEVVVGLVQNLGLCTSPTTTRVVVGLAVSLSGRKPHSKDEANIQAHNHRYTYTETHLLQSRCFREQLHQWALGCKAKEWEMRDRLKLLCFSFLSFLASNQ